MASAKPKLTVTEANAKTEASVTEANAKAKANASSHRKVNSKFLEN